MFRACVAQTSRCVASSSSSAFLHTSAVVNAAAKKRLTNKAKQELKAARWEKEHANLASVILGTRPGEEDKWHKCDLAKLLVKEEELNGPPVMKKMKTPVGIVEIPAQMAFGVADAETKMLFGELPRLSTSTGRYEVNAAAKYSNAETRELKKAKTFAKLVDLRNADADGIAYENRRRIILAFSTPENPYDPGRIEVQAAILTYRIRNLWTHLTTFKRDVGNRLGLRKLVHHRAKILRYLRRTNRERYEILLERLALETESVEGELIV